MKFDPGKSFPYPVLRPGNNDYEKVEFQVDPTIDRVGGTTALTLSAEFELSDPDLLALEKSGVATYCLLVRCHTTHFRRLYTDLRSGAKIVIEDGELSDRTEVCAFLVCTTAISDFRAQHWHSDYQGMHFNLDPGSVLAQDEPWIFWVDKADEGSIGSMFELIGLGNDDGEWYCDLNEERVRIVMSESDFKEFTVARNRAQSTASYSHYIMNGVYLPALAWLLAEADQSSTDYRSCRWYSCVQNRLEQLNLPPLCEGDSSVENRLIHAQKLFEQPFSKFLNALVDGPS